MGRSRGPSLLPSAFGPGRWKEQTGRRRIHQIQNPLPMILTFLCLVSHVKRRCGRRRAAYVTSTCTDRHCLPSHTFLSSRRASRPERRSGTSYPADRPFSSLSGLSKATLISSIGSSTGRDLFRQLHGQIESTSGLTDERDRRERCSPPLRRKGLRALRSYTRSGPASKYWWEVQAYPGIGVGMFEVRRRTEARRLAVKRSTSDSGIVLENDEGRVELIGATLTFLDVSTISTTA